MYPIYNDHQYIIVGRPTNVSPTSYAVMRMIADVIAAGAPKRPVYVINADQKAKIELQKAGLKASFIKSKQPRNAGGCAWWMPTLHQLQGRPWTSKEIDSFFLP